MQRTSPGEYLHELYRRFVGPVEDSRTVYAGFGLFFTGVGLVIVSIAAFLWSTTVPPGETVKYVFRELAVATGATGIPLVLLAVTVLLPVSRRIAAVGALGFGACVAATVRFTQIYWQHWFQNSSFVVGLYALGAVIVVATAGTALSGYRVERAIEHDVPARSEIAGEETGDDAGNDGESYSDEEIQRDIEAAMDSVDLNWGGVERDDGERLTLTESDDTVEQVSLANAKVNEAHGESVDAAVNGLRGLRGGEKKTASGAGTDDQASALQELRAAQQEQEERNEAQTSDGLLGSIRSLFR
ncbi:hypothetical protein G3I44_15060 [Halogeometricum borinquense]|uniref:Cell division protein A N-terminal domain-containing protein n=2 Tax=Halogeometricum borinquense TaxID=60847 RepID=E4NUJ0_HALBP|nr:hypothetical protein [Halogeometricum borinquense]ADQ68710.1 hypothetical protein Hbor_31750 [Halogeometricum borinquense DSM 11551]ELY25450.1 hypothetical protein C499_13225 [Halogeometricum borinquense DSM 11551]QIB75498.1 hypothetical protein G3I44_15060 [Halogeometricum borinquense]